MIFDTLDNLKNYSSINPFMPQVLEFLDQVKPSANLELKKYEIAPSKNVYAAVSEDQKRLPDDAMLEAHQQYIDIQIALDNKDKIGWLPISECKYAETKYDPESDIIFFSNDPSDFITLTPGKFAIFFPGDAHMPLLGDGKVKKMIIKVRAVENKFK